MSAAIIRLPVEYRQPAPVVTWVPPRYPEPVTERSPVAFAAALLCAFATGVALGVWAVGALL